MDIAEEEMSLRMLLLRVRSEETRKRFDAKLAELLTAYKDPAGTDETRRAAAEGLRQLRASMRQEVPTSQLGYWYVGLAAFVAAIYFLLIILYMWGLGADRYAAIETTRPILVFTLIVAMLGFGGLLIARALFSPETDDRLQSRFRLAREVFLIYSGIFGTIIGFYFGAGNDAPPPTAALTVKTVVENRVLTADVEGGSDPFVGWLSKQGASFDGRLLNGDGRKLAISLGTDECPVGAKVTVADGRGRRAEREIAAGDVKGWEGCGGEPEPAPTNTTEPTENAAGNVVNENALP